MGLKLSEKKALNKFIDDKIQSGYGIILDFRVQKHEVLKTKISKENYSVANQYVKKHAEKTWWRDRVGKPKPTIIKKRNA